MNEHQKDFRRRILETAYRVGEGHIPSALSIVDIVLTLYGQIMQDGDQFVLSKGHGSLALYAALEYEHGTKALEAFCQNGGAFGGHPARDAGGLIEFATGSLGHGLPAAVGMALAKKLKGEPGRVFCLVGDGEMQEGSSLEALRLIHELDIANLCLIVDANGTHGKLGPLVGTLRAHEFHVRVVSDGNDPAMLAQAFAYSTYPVAVVARTVKGYGVPAMANDPAAWHRRIPTAAEYAAMMEFLA